MRRKEARVEVRMTEHEKGALKRKAAKNGMTVSEYARTLLANSDDATIRVIDTEPLRKAAHELAKQGTNLNQFMKFLNTYGIKVFDAGGAQRVLAREVETFMEVAEALAALRREADRNNVHLKNRGFRQCRKRLTRARKGSMGEPAHRPSIKSGLLFRPSRQFRRR